MTESSSAFPYDENAGTRAGVPRWLRSSPSPLKERAAAFHGLDARISERASLSSESGLRRRDQTVVLNNVEAEDGSTS